MSAKKQLAWAVSKFGAIALDPRERALRFVEEAIELAQTQGVEPEVLDKIAKRVYAGEPGDSKKEAGQCLMTLSTLAFNAEIDLDLEYQREWHRIQLIPDSEWKRRHQSKVDLGIASN